MNAEVANPNTPPPSFDEWRGRVDVRLDHLEKGQDKLQAVIEKQADKTRWTIGIGFGILAIVIGLLRFFAPIN